MTGWSWSVTIQKHKLFVDLFRGEWFSLHCLRLFTSVIHSERGQFCALLLLFEKLRVKSGVLWSIRTTTWRGIQRENGSRIWWTGDRSGRNIRRLTCNGRGTVGSGLIKQGTIPGSKRRRRSRIRGTLKRKRRFHASVREGQLGIW